MRHTAEEKFIGLIIGASTAWALATLLVIINVTLIEGTLLIIPFYLLYSIIFGFPLSLIITFTLGLALWLLFESFQTIKIGSAIIGGIVAGTLVGMVTFSLGISLVTSFLILPLIGGISGYMTLRSVKI